MKVKVLAEDLYQVVAIMDNDACPAEDFIQNGEKSTNASRNGLITMLGHVASKGLQGVPSGWSHEANKQEGIFEFIKGNLRLFYFKGEGRQIAVCTGGAMKKGRKADKPSVDKAVSLKTAYLKAIKDKTFEVLEDETE